MDPEIEFIVVGGVLDLTETVEPPPPEIIPRRKRRTRCGVCGSCLLTEGRARHERTQKHKDGQYITHDRFEMKT